MSELTAKLTSISSMKELTPSSCLKKTKRPIAEATRDRALEELEEDRDRIMVDTFEDFTDSQDPPVNAERLPTTQETLEDVGQDSPPKKKYKPKKLATESNGVVDYLKEKAKVSTLK